MHRNLIYFGLALAALLPACEGRLAGSSTPGASSNPAVLLEEVRLEGSTLEPCEVSIDGEADADGQADRKWTASKSLAADDGSELKVSVKVQAKDLASGKTHHRRVTLTFYE